MLSDESKEKIANLLLNFQLDMLMISSNTDIYVEKIKNSVLADHMPAHKNLYKDLDSKMYQFLQRLQRVLDADPILKLSALVFTSIQNSVFDVMQQLQFLCVQRTDQEISRV